jgi:hypothetical protein
MLVHSAAAINTLMNWKKDKTAGQITRYPAKKNKI